MDSEQILLACVNHLGRNIERDYNVELTYVTCKYGPVHMFIPDVCIFAYNEAVSEFGSFDPEEDSVDDLVNSLGRFGLDEDLLRLACLFVELSLVKARNSPDWTCLDVDPTWTIVAE